MDAAAPDSGSAGSTQAGKFRVFISYSRADSDFADELAGGLDYGGGFEVTMDRQAIHEGENWKDRLSALIANADTVVFILTPASVSSSTVKWEAEKAAQLSKRMLPVLAAPLQDAAPPDQLAELNYVRFDPEDDGRPRSFIAGLTALRHALNTDIDWQREHTRLLTRAREWISADKNESRLLLGSDIDDAKQWLMRAPGSENKPTDLHHDFIHASEKAQEHRHSADRRRAETFRKVNGRLRWALVAIGVLAAGMGVAAYQIYIKSIQVGELAAVVSKLQNGSSNPPSDPALYADRDGSSSLALKTGKFVELGTVQVDKSLRLGLVKQSISFKDPSGTIWTVPKGFISSGASIPNSIWPVLGAPLSGQYMRPSVLHDYYSFSRERSWQDAHKMYYEALIAAGVSKVLAGIIYAGVLSSGPRWPEPANKTK